MNEIRFSQPKKIENVPERVNERIKDTEVNFEKNSMRKSSYSFKNFFIFIFIIAFSLAAFWAFRYTDPMSIFFLEKGDSYTAVFLSNGQVYFGKILENKREILIMDNVYYLQSSEGSVGPVQNQFTLVKLGTEIHGPVDKLFVNKDQVMFYEYLRDDSKVVESIKAMK